jgi:hypothetical protein
MPNLPTKSVVSYPLDDVDAWDIFGLAVLIRETLKLAGGESREGLTLVGDGQEAVMLGLDRLISMARTIAVADDL